MKGPLQLFLLPVIMFLLPTGHQAAAQEDYHQFSNKDGAKIEAKIVSVTPDWKTMKIQMRDGRDFDMAVNVLSLDDQQTVKKWISANPGGAKVDYNLEVEIEKKAKTAKNERDSVYKYRTTEVSYEIAIKNRTRQDLVGARVDYVVIVEDVIKISRTETGQPEYGGSGTEGELVYLRKSRPLDEVIPFNHDHTFLTEPVENHQIFGDGSVSYGEDKMLGVILKLVGANGETIGEYRSNEAHVQRVTWDQVKGDEFGSPAMSSAADEESPAAPEMAAVAELPDWLEVRELDSLPPLLQKGDTIAAGNLPQWGQEQIRITALVDIDEERSGGTIIACGGRHKGFSLFVLNGALHFWVRKPDDENTSSQCGVEIPLSDLPDTQFKVAAEYRREGLKLWIDDDLKAEGESLGLIVTPPQEGLSVGYDSGDSAVGAANPPHAFPGTINDVQVKIGGSSFN